jgi:hypothetical protein
MAERIRERFARYTKDFVRDMSVKRGGTAGALNTELHVAVGPQVPGCILERRDQLTIRQVL